jgi:hypothetical protein
MGLAAVIGVHFFFLLSSVSCLLPPVFCLQLF